jgi:hypothetical protein
MTTTVCLFSFPLLATDVIYQIPQARGGHFLTECYADEARVEVHPWSFDK